MIKRGIGFNGKHGQFFLLAAIIISVVILSLGYTVNEARVNKEPENFYDLTYELKKETGSVLNYEIYKRGSDYTGEEFRDFADSVARAAVDENPDSNVIIATRSKGGVEIKNYGSFSIQDSNGNVISGENEETASSVTFFGVESNTGTRVGDDDSTLLFINSDHEMYKELVNGLEVKIKEQSYPLNFGDDRDQIIVITEKEVDGESFVSVEI